MILKYSPFPGHAHAWKVRVMNGYANPNEARDVIILTESDSVNEVEDVLWGSRYYNSNSPELQYYSTGDEITYLGVVFNSSTNYKASKWCAGCGRFKNEFDDCGCNARQPAAGHPTG